jgi:tetratricopeptide (TPR) repeat protein
LPLETRTQQHRTNTYRQYMVMVTYVQQQGLSLRLQAWRSASRTAHAVRTDRMWATQRVRAEARPCESRASCETKQSTVAVSVVSAFLAATILNASSPALATESFLRRTGAKGILMQEEESLLRLREREEEKVKEELVEAREEFEKEAVASFDGSTLCVTPFGVDVVGITEAIALTGALVGGLSARRRKDELEKLNEQLRTINSQLRQQARAGTLYAPGLTYVPPTSGGSSSTTKTTTSMPSATTTPSATGVSLPTGAIRTPQAVRNNTPKAVVVGNTPVEEKEGSNGTGQTAPLVSLASIDEEDMRPEVKQCQAALKEGKRLLREQEAGPAMVRFEKALMLARTLGDKVRERRAVRGLAAANRLLGRYEHAIDYLMEVLALSKVMNDHVGDVDAYGSIADIYTELGNFDKAVEYYDMYIAGMTESTV